MRIFEVVAPVHGVGEVDRDQLAVAVGHEAVAAALHRAAHAPVVGELAVVDHRRRR